MTTVSVNTKNFIFTAGTCNVYRLKMIKFSGGEVPLEHIQDAKKLDADAIIDLYEITLSDKSTKIYLKSNNSVTWQGNLFEGTGINLSGVGSHSDDETARPKLTLYNPQGVYSYLIDRGLLDNSIIKRIRVLKVHLDSDSPISRSQQWRVSRVASLRKNIIALELRDMLDGQFFQTPARMFIPPEFPQVSLK